MSHQDKALRRLSQVGNQCHSELEDQNDQTQKNLSELPILPPRATYLFLDNSSKRNALSVRVLRSLRDQLHAYNRSPVDQKLRTLPPFDPKILNDFEAAYTKSDAEAVKEYSWLIDAEQWARHREGLPRVIVLRSIGPVFCSGHDLREVNSMSYDQAKQLFALCAEVMSLIRHSPVPIISVVQGLATAAGAQLALTTDLSIAHASTCLRLPGSRMGLPCVSPVTAVSRRLGQAAAYRMFALSEPCRVDSLPGQPIEVIDDNIPLNDVVTQRVLYYTEQTAAQSHALGKWAFWTQAGFNGGTVPSAGGDGYEDATIWAGRAMALLAQTGDAKEGITAFLNRRPPDWKT